MCADLNPSGEPEGLPIDHPGELQYDIDRERLRGKLVREARRHQFWRAGIVGVVAGIAGVAFLLALRFADHIRGLFWLAISAYGNWGLLISVVSCSILAGSATWLTFRFAPEASGSGIPHIKAVLLGLRGFRWFRVILTKFVGGFLGLAAGLSLGREGPTVQIGAAVGKAVAQWFGIPLRSHKTLVAAGAGAGISAAFNAPLAGFLFVIEELQRELTPVTYGTALIASVAADAVTRLIVGQQASFRIMGYPTPPMQMLPVIAVLGIAAGLLGVAFNRALLSAVKQTGRMPVPALVRGLVAGAVTGVALWYVPAIVGGGQHTAEIVLSDGFTVGNSVTIIFLMLMGKLVLTVLSYASGAPGGIFAPMLVLGAFLGLLFGKVVHLITPGAPLAPAALAVIGMAALFAASVRAPLTGVVLIVEMTGNYEQLYALIVACLSAYLTAELMRNEPVYEALLNNDLHKPDPAGGQSHDPILRELYVEPSSFLDGRQVSEFLLPPECGLISILRGRNEIVPNDSFHIMAGDVLVVIAEAEDAHALHKIAGLARWQRWHESD